MKEKNRRMYVYVWALCFLYVLPIIIANRYIYDDTQRVFYHSAGWALDGRPLMELLFELICNANTFIYDVFPLPLLLSVTAFSVISVKWSEKFYEADGAVKAIVSFLPFSMPFFLSNLSYRFDCIGFTLSVVILMLPFMYRREKIWQNLLISSGCILASMCFYQPSVGLYIALALLVAYFAFIREEKFVERLLTDAGATVIGTVIYKAVIATIFVDKLDWRANANRLVSSQNDMKLILVHVSRVARLIAEYFISAGARQLALYVVIRGFGGVVLWLLLKGLSRTKQLWGLILYCILPEFLCTASILPMLALATPYAHPRQQTGLMIIMFLLAFCVVTIWKHYPRTALCLGILVILSQFSFSYAYGNLLRTQKEYEESTVHDIMRDIDDAGIRGTAEIAVWNEIPYSPVVESTCELMPIFREIVPPGLDNDGMLGGAIINHYSRNRLNFVELTDEAKEFMETNEPFSKNSIYELYVDGRRIYVRFP